MLHTDDERTIPAVREQSVEFRDSPHEPIHRNIPMDQIYKILERLSTNEGGEKDEVQCKMFEQCFPTEGVFQVIFEGIIPNPDILTFTMDKTCFLAVFEVEREEVEEMFDATEEIDEDLIVIYSVLGHVHAFLNRPIPHLLNVEFFHVCDLFYDILQTWFFENGLVLYGGVEILNDVMNKYIPMDVKKLVTFRRTRNEIEKFSQVPNLIPEHVVVGMNKIPCPHDYRRLHAMITGFLDYGNSQAVHLPPEGHLIFTLKCSFIEPSVDTVAAKNMWDHPFSSDVECPFNQIEPSGTLDNSRTWSQLFLRLSYGVTEIPNIMMKFGAGREDLFVHNVDSDERDEFLPGSGDQHGLEAMVTELMTRRWQYQISFYIWKVGETVRMYIGYADHRLRIRCRRDVRQILSRLAAVVVVPLNLATQAVLGQIPPVFSAYPFTYRGQPFVRLIYLNKTFRDNLRQVFQTKGITTWGAPLTEADFCQMHGVLNDDVCLVDEDFDSIKRELEQTDGISLKQVEAQNGVLFGTPG